MSESIIARLEKSGKKFEILVRPKKTYEFLEGKKIPVSELLVVDEVFMDARRGNIASRDELKTAFGTDDVIKVAEVILREGEVQITAEQRKKLQEQKLNWIVNYIHKNFVDPQTNAPHPVQRIKKAIKQAKVKIDPYKEPERQIKEVIGELRKVLPLKSSHVRIRVVIPSVRWSQMRSFLHGQGKILSEKWSDDGSEVRFEVEIPVGAQPYILEKVGAVGGRVENP